MKDSGDGDVEPRDSITLVIRKVHVYVVAALIIGLGGGFGISQAFFDSSADDGGTSAIEQSGAQPTGSNDTAQTPPGNSAQQPTVVQIRTDGRPFKGPDDSPVTVVEFTDYQCPFCSRHFRQTLPQLLSTYEDRVKFVIMNYPISTIHPLAQKASEAVECAYDQGKFWEYHDLLFNNQPALDDASLKGYAASLQLDTSAFSTCLDSGEKASQVLADFQTGQNAGVRGTPTFFINGQRIVGAQPLAAFSNLIDSALSQ